MYEDKLHPRRHTLSLLCTGVGLVLFWRGVWETSAYLFSEHISLILGTMILVLVAVWEKKQVFKFFGGAH
jgi:hypothetical protein